VKVILRHAVVRKTPNRIVPNLRWIEARDLSKRIDPTRERRRPRRGRQAPKRRVDDASARTHDFGYAPIPRTDHWSSREHRFDHDEPEGFRPGNREKKCGRFRKQSGLSFVCHWSGPGVTPEFRAQAKPEGARTASDGEPLACGFGDFECPREVLHLPSRLRKKKRRFALPLGSGREAEFVRIDPVVNEGSVTMSNRVVAREENRVFGEDFARLSVPMNRGDRWHLGASEKLGFRRRVKMNEIRSGRKPREEVSGTSSLLGHRDEPDARGKGASFERSDEDLMSVIA
jgi:hypothetical protein